MSTSFLPKTILITGASSGLGRALARAYALHGVTLFLSGRDAERLKETARLCTNYGAEVYQQLLDVTDKEAMADWITNCHHQKPIDLVIANAGISGGTSGHTEDDNQTRRIFATNIDGVLNTVLPAIPLMQKQGRGQIALISSLASFRGLPSAPSYSGSKATVRIYGEGLRGVLHKFGIGVTVVTPGYIRTPMTDVNNFPMPLIMEPEKAASIIKNKLQKNPSRIAFPALLYALIHSLSCLPPGLTDPLFRLLPSKPAVE